MKADFWHKRWHENQIGFHQSEVHLYLTRYWRRLKLAADARVFVPLCGKSLDISWLAECGHTVVGVEISPIAVEDFFKEAGVTAERSKNGKFEIWRHENIELFCGDFFNLDSDRLTGISAVYDRASLIAFPTDMREHYAQHLQLIIEPNTPILLVTLEYAQKAMQGPPFAVMEDEVYELYRSKYDIDLLEATDVIDESPRWRQAGLNSLIEKCFLLTPM